VVKRTPKDPKQTEVERGKKKFKVFSIYLPQEIIATSDQKKISVLTFVKMAIARRETNEI
jgi:hypothetical protein